MQSFQCPYSSLVFVPEKVLSSKSEKNTNDQIVIPKFHAGGVDHTNSILCTVHNNLVQGSKDQICQNLLYLHGKSHMHIFIMSHAHYFISVSAKWLKRIHPNL